MFICKRICISIWTQKQFYVSGEHIYTHTYIYVCVCVQKQTMRECRRTDGWRTSVLERTHVWHLHTSCSMYDCICGETQEEFLLCLRSEKKNNHREGWERKVTYPLSCGRETLSKRKGMCHALGTTCAPFLLTLEDTGSDWKWHMTWWFSVKGLLSCAPFTQILIWRGQNIYTENGSLLNAL